MSSKRSLLCWNKSETINGKNAFLSIFFPFSQALFFRLQLAFFHEKASLNGLTGGADTKTSNMEIDSTASSPPEV